MLCCPYQGAACEGAPYVSADFELGQACTDYGSAAAKFGYNFSSGNFSVHVYVADKIILTSLPLLSKL